jgi:hypothetical protein
MTFGKYDPGNPTFETFLREEIEMMRDLNMTKAPLLAKNGSTLVPWDHRLEEDKYWMSNKFNQFRYKELPKMLQDNGITKDYTTGTAKNALVRKGVYALQLRRWFRDYPRDSILVVDYDDIQNNITEIYYKILDFVGIPQRKSVRSWFEKKQREGHAYPSPLSDSTKKYLQAFYAPYNAELKDILGEAWRDIWVQGKEVRLKKEADTPPNDCRLL